MMNEKPTTMADYLYLVDQATFDAGDLAMAVGNDEEETDPYMELVGTLEQQLKALQTSIVDGSYQFADQDLPFMVMVMVRQFESNIPFADMLKLINEVHRSGLGG